MLVVTIEFSQKVNHNSSSKLSRNVEEGIPVKSNEKLVPTVDLSRKIYDNLKSRLG